MFLSPDGDLCRLPFEGLPYQDGRYVIDDFSVSYVSAGRDVLRFTAGLATKTSPPLVAADPDFDLGDAENPAADSASEAFEPLPETRVEGEQVARLLGVAPLLGRDVLETTLKAQRSPRVLHIATHGFFQPDVDAQPTAVVANRSGNLTAQLAPGRASTNTMLRSGLALAGANGRLRGFQPPPAAEDGILTAEDVGLLDLTGTDLVVLSACETGLGAIHVGEAYLACVARSRSRVRARW